MDLNDQEFDSEFNDDEKYSDNHLNDQDDNQAEDKDSDEALNEIKDSLTNQINSRYGFHIQDIELSDERRKQIVGDEQDEAESLSFYGINKNIYRKYKNGKQLSNIIKTGTDFNLLPRNPEFLPKDDPYEPLYVPKADVLENALKREIEKFCFSDTLINKVVYDCSESSPFNKESQLQELELDMLPYYVPTNQNDTTLVFESRFESGNLKKAIQISEFEYNLILKPDYFTSGNTQWYYFSIANVKKNQEYRLNIINMMKPDSLYNQGMKPLVYSETLARRKGVGWYRDGYDICYYQNNMKKKNGGYYYSLAFSMKFPFKHDTVYITHSYPYTYSQLLNYLDGLEVDPLRKHKLKRKNLCQTIAGNNCDYLVITDYKDGKNEDKKDKRTIMITSRVHPGETMASYMMEYMIDYLTGTSMEAQLLRENFVFKIIPMLNIDGVLNGNYRVSLCGLDLNRQWANPSKQQHPTIYHAKQMIKKLKEQKNLVFFCDIHGHSRKKNLFMYGCSGKDPQKKELAFPMLMKNKCSVFSFKDCSFAVQKEKEGTARIAIWKEFNLIHCYTLEASFCGADFGKYEFFHYNQEIFYEIAQSFCKCLIDMFDPDQSKVKMGIEEAEAFLNGYDRQKNDRLGDNSDLDSDYENSDEEKKKEKEKNEQNDKEKYDDKKKKVGATIPSKKKKI